MVKIANGGKPHGKVLKQALKQVREYIKHPESFLTSQSSHSNEISLLTKSIYDHALSTDTNVQKSYLDELMVSEMDEEQIWQQLELKNEHLLEAALPKASKILSMGCSRMPLKFHVEGEENGNGAIGSAGSANESDNGEKNFASPQPKPKPKKVKNKSKKKAKSSIVDDQFFKLDDMARFLDAEDKREMLRQSGKSDRSGLMEIDYFSENIEQLSASDDDDGVKMKYSDFFGDDDDDDDDDDDEGDTSDEDPANAEDESNNDEEDSGDDTKQNEHDSLVKLQVDDDSEDEVERNRRLRYELYNTTDDFIPGNESKKPTIEAAESSDDESAGEGEAKDEPVNNSKNQDVPKSSFEVRQEKLKNRIQKMEDQLLQDKPWQLKGEITADTRPQNSLLEEVLEFESTTRPAPVITEETTMRLEDIIRQRIKNKAYDDVEQKVRPQVNPKEYRKELVLDAEKSKQSLAQIYEKDYLKQLEKSNPDADQTEEAEPQEHQQIRNMMKTLLAQLDALSNFHYTPRPAVPELKIITNTPAISMEEVAPVATSDAALLAPEEVKNRPKGNVMSKDERTKTDKHRERRLKKRFQREKFNRQAEKERKLLEKGVAPKTKDLQEKLLKKVTKAKNVNAMAETSGVAKSSTAFFSQLQTEMSTKHQSAVKSKKNNAGVQATHVKL